MQATTRIYLFQFSRMFMVIMPVIVPFYLDLGLSMHEIFQLQALFGITVVICEVPTGYICDLWGRKSSLIVASAMAALGYSYLCVASSFWQLAAFQVLMGIAFSQRGEIQKLPARISHLNVSTHLGDYVNSWVACRSWRGLDFLAPSDTAEYGCYLFAHACVPLLANFMSKVDTDVIGKAYGTGSNGVDNLELIAVNTAIQNHPVEIIGRELRGYMTAMKAIAVGAQ